MSYNGWSSYETWNVLLWLDNDETLYDIFDSRCGIWKRCGMAPSDLKYSIVMSYLDMGFRNDDGPATPDGVSLYDPKVNWREIYDHFVDRWDVDVDEDGVSVVEEIENKEMFGG